MVHQVGALADRGRGGPGARGGRGDGPVCAVGGGLVGGAQGRRGVRAAGSHRSGRAHRRGARRGGGGVRVDLRQRHVGWSRGTPGAADRRSGRVRALRGSDNRRRPAGAAGDGRHRLRHVHLWVHRSPQGSGDQPRRPAGGGCGATRNVRVGPAVEGVDGGLADVRCVDLRAVFSGGVGGNGRSGAAGRRMPGRR